MELLWTIKSRHLAPLLSSNTVLADMYSCKTEPHEIITDKK